MNRIVTVEEPQERGRHRGLAYTLFLPEMAPVVAVLVLHGADSSKESHQAFARACRKIRYAALCFDQRGHGESDGPMDGRAIADVVAMADLLRQRTGRDVPLALRGSSMGGYFAITAAQDAGAGAVVAICPASGDGLRRSLAEQRFSFAADTAALTELIDDNDVASAAARYEGALLLLHAEGDLQVPIEHSRELHRAAPGSKFIAVPGGHHRSIQHDAELEGVTLRWLRRSLVPPTG
jgi:pimeloyl-ACP methyl ester carboxylesterase